MRLLVPPEEAMRMTPAERMAQSQRLSEEYLADFMRENGLTREEAIGELRKRSQIGRRYSKCMTE